MIPLAEKRITSEVCVHHLHFTSDDYTKLGYLIKCNPAIKAPQNRDALWKALLDDRLDLIATDHAPHTLEEKGFYRNENGEFISGIDGKPGVIPYEKAHAGLPLVQHSLLLMLHYVREGKISLEKVVEKMCHAPAICFQIAQRGFIREGYFADLVIADLQQSTIISNQNILFKCAWSPLEKMVIPAQISHTFINGHLVYGKDGFDESQRGQRLLFNR